MESKQNILRCFFIRQQKISCRSLNMRITAQGIVEHREPVRTTVAQQLRRERPAAPADFCIAFDRLIY